jgi:Flp pilus assembly pilin Flp
MNNGDTNEVKMSKAATVSRKDTSQASKPSLLRDTEGMTTVEYIIVLCLIAVVGFGVWQKFGQTVQSKVDGADSVISGLPSETSDGTGGGGED